MAPNDEPNPYAPLAHSESAAPPTDLERFVLDEVGPQLRAKEKVRHVALLAQTANPWAAVLVFVPLAVGVTLASMWLRLEFPPWIAGAVGGLFGGLFIALRTRLYGAVVTKRRIVLVRLRQGAMGPAPANLGVEEIHWKDVEQVRTGGFANNRSLTFRFRDGNTRTLRIAPWSTRVSGNRAFLEAAPSFVRPAREDEDAPNDAGT